MNEGVRITVEEYGYGLYVLPVSRLVVRMEVFLEDGRKVAELSGRQIVEMGSPATLPGLREGLQGMAEDERRELLIPPHLAYGNEGLPGVVPGGATLRCHVWLIQVRPGEKMTWEASEVSVDNGMGGKRTFPWWSLDLKKDRDPSVSLGSWFTPGDDFESWHYFPSPGVEWQASELAQMVQDLYREYPLEFLREREVEFIPNEDCGGHFREPASGSGCVNLCLRGKVDDFDDQWLYIFIREDSAVWLGSEICRRLNNLISPLLPEGMRVKTKEDTKPD